MEKIAIQTDTILMKNDYNISPIRYIHTSEAGLAEPEIRLDAGFLY